MKKTILFGLGLLFVIGIASLITVFAYKGDPNIQGPNYDADVQAQMEAAIESGDYDAWIALREENNLPMNGKIFQVINADNFDKYTALHNAMEDGDYETANTIRTELGLGQGMMKHGNGQGNAGNGTCAGSSGSCPYHNTNAGVGNQAGYQVHNCPMQQ
jgi:hypothetical protein